MSDERPAIPGREPAGRPARQACLCDAALRGSRGARGCRALVIDRGSFLLDSGGILALVQRLACPVFVVR